MSYTTNYSGNNDFKPINGTFEAEITAARKTKTQAGAKMISIDYTIRGDVAQEFGSRKVNYDNVAETAHWKADIISKSICMDEGRCFNDFYDWADAIVGGTLQIVVETNDKYPRVVGYDQSNMTSYPLGSKPKHAPTAAPNTTPTPKAKAADLKPLDDEDLPF